MGAITKLVANFVETEVDGEVLLVDMAGGELFAMDGTAREIWQLIDGTRDRDSLLAALLERYPEDDGAEVAGQSDRLLDELSAASLIAC